MDLRPNLQLFVNLVSLLLLLSSNAGGHENPKYPPGVPQHQEQQQSECLVTRGLRNLGLLINQNYVFLSNCFLPFRG